MGNAIGIQEPPGEMYGKLMSISDALMWRYWTLLTDVRASEIEAMQAEVTEGALHPMQAKKNLAWTITAGFHGEAAAEKAGEGWAAQFQGRGVSEDVAVVPVARSAEGLIVAEEGGAEMVRAAKLLVLAGLASSAGEATRKLAEGAVSVDGEKFSGRMLGGDVLRGEPLLRLGKKQVRVEWA